jgi:predicted DNA-binding protein (UPF0278 family)
VEQLPQEEIKEEEVSSLKTLYDILHNRIIQKKRKCIGLIIEHIRTTYREIYRNITLDVSAYTNSQDNIHF